MKVAVILPAAGLGTRMGKGTAEKAGTSRKQFMLLDGSPILMHTVRKFAASDRVGEIVVAVRAEDIEWVREHAGARSSESGRVRVVEGGNSRQESVENALRSLGPDTDLVAVHDAVRPFIDLETIHKVFDEAAETGAAIVGVPAVDTVKQVTPRHQPRARPRHPAARKAGDGADAAGIPLRSAGARLRIGARRTASSAPTNPAWWSAWTWKSAWCWAATAISRSPSPATWNWRTCSCARKRRGART